MDDSPDDSLDASLDDSTTGDTAMAAGARWSTTWDELKSYYAELSCLETAAEVLAWDERTYMPPAAGLYRSEQLTLLAGLAHQRRTSPRLGEWLATLSTLPVGTLPEEVAVSVRWLVRDYDRNTKLPQSLVEALTRATSRGQQVWETARAANDYAAFRPYLAEIVRLKREQAAALGYTKSPYDPLLDEYEPGATVAWLTPLLAELRDRIVPLVDAIHQRRPNPDDSLLHRHFPVDRQRQLGCQTATEFGFDFRRGRLDVTHHPFCLTAGPDDCRITTRFHDHDFSMAYFGILHEAGHGLYEQGLPREQFGLPLGCAASLGVHESQSRMWENFVGRHPSFWQYVFPQAQNLFPESLGDVDVESFWQAINVVRPSLIRVEADEVTYNLHIVIRFELEQALIAGELEVDELPSAWNQRYQSYLGLTPPSDADGVMQDVHWSAGLFGYFPTYSLGNLYAAMLWDALGRDLGDRDLLLAQGNFRPVLDWLRANVHAHGRRWPAAELVERACGGPPSSAPLVRYLTDRFLGAS
ncbi:MAG: carboxypeptidase M32 [Pirellulales bacterium]